MNARRAALACFLVSGVLAAAAAAPVAARGGAPAELLPDLVTAPLDGLAIDRSGGHKALRFSNTIANDGLGVVELRPRRRDCDGDGNFSNDRLAIQRIYVDDGSGEFERGVDTIGRTVEVGCMRFHVAHDHWHLERFARYVLRSALDGAVVSRAPKVSFCLRDSLPFDADVPGHQPFPYYGECHRNSTTGLSVGWGDLYSAYLAGQRLSLAGLPNGRYCLISNADPADAIDESVESNNAASALLRIRARTVTDLGACP